MSGDLIIEITPDDPIVEVKDPKAEKVAKVEKVIEPSDDLKQQFDALQKTANADKAEAARLRTEASTLRQTVQQTTHELTKSQGERIASDEAAIQNAVAAEKAFLEGAKRDKKSAILENNVDAMADADERMALAAGRLVRLEEGLSDVETRKKEAPKVAPKPDDSFEGKISNAPPKIQAWLRAHPEYVDDTKQNNRANAAHSMALADGVAYGSDEYIEYCEKFLGLKEDEGEKPKPKENGTRKMPAAPVSRDGGVSTSGGNSTQVTLTPGEQRAAQDGSIVWTKDDPKIGAVKNSPIGLKEYARRKMIMQQEGRYDKSYTES